MFTIKEFIDTGACRGKANLLVDNLCERGLLTADGSVLFTAKQMTKYFTKYIPNARDHCFIPTDIATHDNDWQIALEIFCLCCGKSVSSAGGSVCYDFWCKKELQPRCTTKLLIKVVAVGVDARQSTLEENEDSTMFCYTPFALVDATTNKPYPWFMKSPICEECIRSKTLDEMALFIQKQFPNSDLTSCVFCGHEKAEFRIQNIDICISCMRIAEDTLLKAAIAFRNRLRRKRIASLSIFGLSRILAIK